MRFFALHEGFYEGVQLRIDQFKMACDKLHIEFRSLDASKLDYTSLPVLGKGDLFYNLSRGSAYAEALLLNDTVTTFYIDTPKFATDNADTIKYTIIHSGHPILQPKTIFNVTDDRALLKIYVDYLDGFPIIIKSAGSTRGIGTIKIDSWQNLISTVDYLINMRDKFIMREFIKAKSGSRMIVLGNEVIAAADFEMNENDFRNAAILSQVKYQQRDYANEIKNIAVTATHLANAELAGVDFLEDDKGDFYLLEVNFPTGYNSLIDICGVDIPLKMVEYLRHKSGVQ